MQHQIELGIILRYDQADRVAHSGQESQRAKGNHWQGLEGLFLHGSVHRQDKTSARRNGACARIDQSHREDEFLPGRALSSRMRRKKSMKSRFGDHHGTNSRSPWQSSIVLGDKYVPASFTVFSDDQNGKWEYSGFTSEVPNLRVDLLPIDEPTTSTYAGIVGIPKEKARASYADHQQAVITLKFVNDKIGKSLDLEAHRRFGHTPQRNDRSFASDLRQRCAGAKADHPRAKRRPDQHRLGDMQFGLRKFDPSAARCRSRFSRTHIPSNWTARRPA